MLLLAARAAAVLIIDGDTIDVDGVRIRLLAIDTPETFRSRCENELALGLKAKERLRVLLAASLVTYKAQGDDYHGRTPATQMSMFARCCWRKATRCLTNSAAEPRGRGAEITDRTRRVTYGHASRTILGRVRACKAAQADMVCGRATASRPHKGAGKAAAMCAPEISCHCLATELPVG